MEKACKCNLCDKKFSCHANVRRHILSKHEGIYRAPNRRFKCNVCGYKARYENELIDHTRTHTGERPFHCTANGCGVSCKTGPALKVHIKYKHNNDRPLKCNFPDCLYSAKAPSDLKTHKKVHSKDKPLSCPKPGCNFRAKLRAYITYHVATVHSEAKPFACSECDYKTATNGSLISHIRYRHSTRRDFKCSYPNCTKSYKSSNHLKRHFSYRHEERSVPCDHPGCENNYANAEALNQHKLNVHSKKNLVCTNLDCSYRTNSSSKIARHMIVHDGTAVNEKIPCSIEGCQYKAKSRNALECHMRRHKTPRIPCPVSGCGQYATTPKAIQDHVKYHNPSTGRRFQCPLCVKHFQKLEQLRNHCFTHTKEKPLACGHCEYASARQADVREHISTAHANIKFPFIAHLLDYRECLECKVILPTVEFLVHCKDHTVQVEQT